MTKTNTAPWDYERPVTIVSQIVKLCAKCGKHMGDTREGLRCISCSHDKYHDVFEHMADVYRRGLEAKQVDEARELAASMLPQMAFVADCLNIVADISDEQVALMNSWIAENDDWKIEQHVNAAYMEPDTRARAWCDDCNDYNSDMDMHLQYIHGMSKEQITAMKSTADLQPEEHASDCMIWQINSAADSGSGFPEPEDVACTCGLVDRLRDADLGARFTLDAFGPLELDTKATPIADEDELPF